MLPKVRDGQPAQQFDGSQVDGHRPFPSFPPRVGPDAERKLESDAGVVHQHVEPPVCVYDLAKHTFARGRLGQVGLEGAGVVPERFGQGFGLRTTVIVMCGYGRPRGSQPFGERLPDASARPGDQDCLPCQIDVH